MPTGYLLSESDRAAIRKMQREISRLRGEKRQRQNVTPRPDSDLFTIKIKNSSGSSCSRFGVLGISSALYSPTSEADAFKSEVVLTGTTPTTATHMGKFVVLVDDIANGSIGRAWLAGVCQVQIDVTDATHTTADVKDSSRAMLQSFQKTGAARILYKESGTGTKWAIIARFSYGSSACS